MLSMLHCISSFLILLLKFCPVTHTVHFSYHVQNYVSRYSLIIEIMPAALTPSSYVETFQFSASRRTVRVSVMSSSFPVADCSTLTDQRLKSFMDTCNCSNHHFHSFSKSADYYYYYYYYYYYIITIIIITSI